MTLTYITLGCVEMQSFSSSFEKYVMSECHCNNTFSLYTFFRLLGQRHDLRTMKPQQW